MLDKIITQKDKRTTIVLLGYMFTGKTTMGKSLAKRLNYDFFDTDTEIERTYHYTVEDIFKKFGEQVFRNMEKKALGTLLKKDNVVIACGGGLPCFFDNMQEIKDNAISIYLKMDTGQIMSRYQKSKARRPLLMNKTEDEVREYIQESLEERQQYYTQADMVVNAFDLTPQRLETELENFLNNTK